MNKARRHELKMLKFKRRMEIYGFKKSLWLSPVNSHNLFAFRSHGTPCSCYACQQPEDQYNRAQEKQRLQKQIQEELSIHPHDESIEDDYWYRVNYDPGFMWMP